jgi:hypothetical protein
MLSDCATGGFDKLNLPFRIQSKHHWVSFCLAFSLPCAIKEKA